MTNIDKTLKKIAKRYNVKKLLWDEMSETFVESICNYFEEHDGVSDRQLAVLVKISERIKLNGKRTKPIPKVEPEHSGYLGINCRTGEVNWYSWQEFERD